ncbi:50S ribosomal protein L29 [candidate division WWE3 bacterium]|uniref:Large ribosomal subunit protein uL29 n=1 Tax=candidate division WWE3 bacterium TaxID=2053526 RepID=A0A7X9E6Y6_UNCKA|nr:50S ribosomal protein L29 [candidate division WWE3 bacterium]
MIKLEEFRKKTKEELKKELLNLEKEVQKVVSNVLQKKEKNVKKVSYLRKDVARVKTLLNEKLKEEGASKE